MQNEDIVPGLLAAIEEDFEKSFQSDGTLKTLYAKVESGKATQADGEKFAHELGRLTAEVFHRNVTPEDLPNQRMYYNIANRIIPPTLRQNYDIVNEVMRQVIEHQNQEAGIGIRYQEPEFDEFKAHELAWVASQEEDYSKIRNTVETGLDTNTRMVADDCVRKNAEFQYDSGLSPKIVRESDGKCCEWCADMAGTYEYKSAPKEVYGRHANCGCTVEFVPGTGKRQNVHTKGWTSETESAMMNSEITDEGRTSESIEPHSILSSTDMEYRELSRIAPTEKEVGPGQTVVVDREVNGGPYKILLSEKLNIKPKGVHEYENMISRALKLIGASAEGLPEFVLVDYTELGDRTRGSFSGDFMRVLYKPELDSEKMMHCVLHELLHWSDYMRATASGRSFQDDSEFITYMSSYAKKKLDKLGIKADNVNEITDYAAFNYLYRDPPRYDEVYVEYRAKKLLKE